jgi:hypothetical protein
MEVSTRVVMEVSTRAVMEVSTRDVMEVCTSRQLVHSFSKNSHQISLYFIVGV